MARRATSTWHRDGRHQRNRDRFGKFLCRWCGGEVQPGEARRHASCAREAERAFDDLLTAQTHRTETSP